MTTSLIALVAVALVGGGLPLVVRWSHRQLHAVLALSTGIFLGAVFLHLLPSISQLGAVFPEQSSHAAHGEHGEHVHAGETDGDHSGAEDGHDHDHDHDHAEDGSGAVGPSPAALIAHQHAPNTIWFFVLLGVVAVYLIEALFLRTHDHGDLHRHRGVGYATLLGVTVHALTAGFGLGAVVHDVERYDVFLVAILGHKGFEAFSLTTVFQLAEFPRRRIVLLMVAFALVTPVGMVLGAEITSGLGSAGLAIATALAAGTFLYVCLSELLPEVFHHREDVLTKIGLLALGVLLMTFFEGMIG